MGWSEILAFTAAAALLVTSPGPNGVLIARTVPTSGRAAGFANIAGFFAAFYVHGALSILGVSLILVQSAAAFAIVKYLGAAYLCWLGLKALWEAYRGAEPPARVAPARRSRTLLKAFLEGLLTNGLNPKVSLFYLAIFPQFFASSGQPVLSALLLVFIHSLINLVWFGAMVMLFHRVTLATRRASVRRWLQAATGVVFIGFGAKLAAYRPSV